MSDISGCVEFSKKNWVPVDYCNCFLASKCTELWILEEVWMETLKLWISLRHFFLSSGEACSVGTGEIILLRYAITFRHGRAEVTCRGFPSLGQNIFVCHWVTDMEHSEKVIYISYLLSHNACLLMLSLLSGCWRALANPTTPHQNGVDTTDGESECQVRANDQRNKGDVRLSHLHHWSIPWQ